MIISPLPESLSSKGIISVLNPPLNKMCDAVVKWYDKESAWVIGAAAIKKSKKNEIINNINWVLNLANKAFENFFFNSKAVLRICQYNSH